MNSIFTWFFALSISMSTLCAAQEFGKLHIKEKVDVYTTLAREPMIAEHPNGALFLTGYRNAGSAPQLWKSIDNGTSWNKVEVGDISTGADGNSDVDLAIDSDGIIYLASMKFTKIPDDITGFDFSTMKGQNITIGVSKDVGKSWKWTYLSQSDYDDRPWVKIAPNNDVHIVWNDGKGIRHMLSANKGDTWQELSKVNPKGGSSHFSIGPKGELAVRVAPLSASGNQFDEGVDLIRLSLDRATSWTNVQLPGNRDWTVDAKKGILRWVEPICWDSKSRLYYLWSEGKSLKLGISDDYGKNWNVQLIEESDNQIYYPYMTITDDIISCTWVSGFGESLRHHASVLKLNTNENTMYRLSPLKLDIWSRFEVGDYQRSTGGEYFPMIYLSDGDFGLATPIQNRKENRFGFTWWRINVE